MSVAASVDSMRGESDHTDTCHRSRRFSETEVGWEGQTGVVSMFRISVREKIKIRKNKLKANSGHRNDCSDDIVNRLGCKF